MARHVYFPVRLRLDPLSLADDGAGVEEAMTTALGRAVAAARRNLPADANVIGHAPVLAWVGPGVPQTSPATRDVVKDAVVRAVSRVSVQSGAPAARASVPPPPRTKRRWRVEVAKKFQVRLDTFLGFCNDVIPFEEDIPSLYYDQWEDVVWGSAWVVRVDELMPVDALVAEVEQRQGELAGFRKGKHRTVGLWSINDWVRKKFLAALPAGALHGGLPSLNTYGGHLRVINGGQWLLGGARVLFLLTVLPDIKWEDKVTERARRVVQVPLAEWRDLIDPDAFEASHRVSWSQYVREFAAEPIDVHFVPFEAKATMSYRSLKHLGRGMIADRVQSEPWYGGVYLLSEHAVAKLPSKVRELAKQESFDALWTTPPGREVHVWIRGDVGALIWLELPYDSSRRLQALYAERGRDDVDALIAVLKRDDRAFWIGQRILGFLRRYSQYGEQSIQFAFMLDELRKRDGGKWFSAFFAAVNHPDATFELPHRMLGLAARHWYASAPEVLATVTKLDARAKRGRQFGYAVDQIDLDKNGKRIVRPGHVLMGWNSLWYSKDEEQRLTKKALAKFEKALQEQTLAVLMEMSQTPNQERDLEDVGKEIFKRAEEKTPLGADDVEEVTYERSLVLKFVRSYEDRQLTRWEVGVAWVQREEGTTEWVPVNREDGRFLVTTWENHGVEIKSSGELEERIFFFEFAHGARATTTFAKVVTWGAVFVIAWQVGAITFLVELGGGWVTVGVSIAISEAFYVISSLVRGEGLTLQGFLVSALVGYLGAVAFHVVTPLIGPVAKQLGAKVGFNSLLRLFAGKLVERAIVGGTVGASTALLTTFTLDLINVASGGRWSSPEDYIKNVAKGMLFGAVLECGVSGFGMMFRAQGLHALGTIADLASRIKLLKIRPGDVVSAGLQSLHKFGEFLGLFKNGRALYAAVRAQWQELVVAVSSNVRASVFLRVLELAENVRLSAAQGAALERLFVAMEGHLSQTASLNLANALSRFTGRTELFLDALGKLDDNSLSALAKTGLLEDLALSPSSLAALRDAPEATFGVLGKAFENRVNDLEGFLTNTARFGATEQLGALQFLALANGEIPASMVVLVMQSAGRLSPEMTSGLLRLVARAGTAVAEKVLGKIAPARVEPFLSLMRTLDDATVLATARSSTLEALSQLSPDALAALTKAAGSVPGKILEDFAKRGLLPSLAESPHAIERLAAEPAAVHNAFAGPFQGSIADLEAFLASSAGAGVPVQSAALAFLNAAGGRVPPDVVLLALSSGKFTADMAVGLLRLVTKASLPTARAVLKAGNPAHIEAFLGLMRALPDDTVHVLSSNTGVLQKLVALAPRDLAAFAELAPHISPTALKNAAAWKDFADVVDGASITLGNLGKERAAPMFGNMLKKTTPKAQVPKLWQTRLATAPELANQPPLNHDSWIVDSQVVLAANSTLPKDQAVRTAFQNWHNARTSPTDLRLTNTTIAEAGSFSGRNARGVALSVKRTDPEYLEMVQTLTPVMDGPGDVAIAADAFFALTEQLVTPKLFTADIGLSVGLARAGGIPTTGLAGNTFTITVRLPSGPRTLIFHAGL